MASKRSLLIASCLAAHHHHHHHHQAASAQEVLLPPLPKIEPLNDGIFLRSVDLPPIDIIALVTDDDADGDGDGAVSGEGGDVATTGDIVGDGRQKNQKSSSISRQRLIMYDFKPAFPPYTRESLGELLLIPKQKKVEEEEEEPTETSKESSIGDKEIQEDRVVEEDRGEEDDGEVGIEKDAVQAQNATRDVSDGSNGSGEQHQIMTEEEGGVIGENEDEQSTQVVEEETKSGDDVEQPIEPSNEAVESASGITADTEEDTLPDDVEKLPTEKEDKDTYVIAEEAEVKNETEVDIVVQEQETEQESKSDQKNGTHHLDDTTTGPSTEGEDESTESVEPPIEQSNEKQESSTAAAEEEADTANEEEVSPSSPGAEIDEEVGLDTAQQQEVTAAAAGLEDADQPSEKIESVANGIISEKREEEEETTSSDVNADAASVVPAEEEKLEEETPATEFDSEISGGDDTLTADTEQPTPEEEQGQEDTYSSGLPVDEEPIQADPPKSEEKISINYDDDTQPILSTATSNNNKDANRQFVDGLDELDKLYERVEVPDELDVGADGSSMQDVLVGQGLKIVFKRAKNFGLTIKEKFESVAGNVKDALPLAQLGLLGDDHEDEHEDLSLDSLMDLSKLGEQLTKDETKKRDDDNMQKEQPLQQTKSEQEEKKRTKSRKDEVKEKIQDFPLIKSKKAQKIWKFARRKWEQARHMLDDIFNIFDSEEEEDDDFGLGDMKLDNIQLGKGSPGMKGEAPKFGSDVDESFLQSRYAAMMKEQQDK